MYFKITYSSIYSWKGAGTEKEQNDPRLMDSFCHLILAHEATTKATWMLLIDQGDNTGVPTSNCIEYIIPRICEKFILKTADLRIFEVWPYHKGDPRLKYTEVVVSAINFDAMGHQVLRNSWKQIDSHDAMILDQLIETVGDKVIREEV